MRISDWSSDVCSSDLKMWGGQYRGQRQRWFLMRFMGEDSDVDIHTKHQEFRAWCWAELDELEKLIVPFKRALYRGLVEEFGWPVCLFSDSAVRNTPPNIASVRRPVFVL